jgi:hypothetical protein
MARHEFLSFFPVLFLLAILIPVFIAWVRIFTRVGWPGWLGILIVVPLVNLVLMMVLGFKEWPIEKRLKSAEGNPPSTRPVTPLQP